MWRDTPILKGLLTVLPLWLFAVGVALPCVCVRFSARETEIFGVMSTLGFGLVYGLSMKVTARHPTLSWWAKYALFGPSLVGLFWGLCSAALGFAGTTIFFSFAH
jgi:hypothetical protein